MMRQALEERLLVSYVATPNRCVSLQLTGPAASVDRCVWKSGTVKEWYNPALRLEDVFTEKGVGGT